MGLGSLLGIKSHSSSSSSSSTSTTTNYTDNSTDITNAASLGMAAMNNTVLGSGAQYESLTLNSTEGLSGDNLKNTLNTVKQLNSDFLSATKTSENNFLDATKKSESNFLDATKTLNSKVLSTAESLYNKSENVLSSVFDKAVSSVQGTASKAMETTAAAYAESDDELRRTIDGLRPIAMYAMLAAMVYFIFRSKKAW